jgi:hypothetical protein
VTLLALAPGAEALAPPPSAPPGVGMALVAELTTGIHALAEALTAWRTAPWCPLVLVHPDRPLAPPALRTFEEVPGTLVSLGPADYPGSPLARRVGLAVRRRAVPSPDTLALWLALRLGQPAADGVFAACFGLPDRAPPPRTLTRRVAALGPLSVRDWRGLGHLAAILADRGHQPPWSLETSALAAGVDPRSLRRWLRLATELTWREVTACWGWEWVLEAALRKHGLVVANDGGIARLSALWEAGPAAGIPVPPRVAVALPQRRYRSRYWSPSSSE